MQSLDDVYARRTAAELTTFAENTNVHDLPQIFHYWSNKYLKPKFDSLGIRGVNEFYEDWMLLAAERTGATHPVFVSIGAGNCDIEIHLAKALRARGLQRFVIQCVELNSTMLQRGRDMAAAEGVVDLMSFEAADFNKWNPDTAFDAVIANQSLHHVLELERLFSTIQHSLKPGGLFLSSDMIGRNGHMRWPEALEIVHAFWNQMPDSYKYNLILQRAEPLYENWDCSTSGFEGIRAQHVLPLLTQYFKFELFLGFGNVVDIFIDRCFGHHFSADRDWDRLFIDRVHARDEQALGSGTITPTHMIAVMTNEEPRIRKYWNGIPPERLIRFPGSHTDPSACPWLSRKFAGPPTMSTDADWEEWGVRDPYYGVLTDPKYRSSVLTPEAKFEFFQSGGEHVDHVLRTCRSAMDYTFTPQRVLDFGCGVGRVLIPFARVARDVVGMDAAPSMLAEARRNCEEHGIANVSLVLSDDTLSKADGQFDLVHSCIVLQHVEVSRGRALFAQLVNKVQAGGCGAIHVTFGWDVHVATFGVPPEAPPVPQPLPPDALSLAKAKVKRFLEPLVSQTKTAELESGDYKSDPSMQMHYYNVSELLFILQRAGVQRFHSEFTDHGGALGVFLYFQKPSMKP